MDLKLQGRKALVTGASSGIGRCAVRMLALEGVQVAAVARRVESVEELAQEVERSGGANVFPICADLYQADAVEAIVKAAKQSLGSIDILFNAAGGSRPVSFDASIEQWNEAMLLNFFRVRELTHAVIPGMRERRWGRIINFTGTTEPRMLNATFSAKASVHIWAKSLSREVGADGVTINCLQPMHIHSEQMSKFFASPAAEAEYAKQHIPLGRFGEPEEIAAIATFLASPLASFITGTTTAVDGGYQMFAF